MRFYCKRRLNVDAVDLQTHIGNLFEVQLKSAKLVLWTYLEKPKVFVLDSTQHPLFAQVADPVSLWCDKFQNISLVIFNNSPIISLQTWGKSKKWPVEAVVDPEQVVHGLDLPAEPEEEISSNMEIHNSDMDLTKENFLVLIIVLLDISIYESDSPGRGNWSKCGIFSFFRALLWPSIWIFSTVLKRFCPLDSRNVFLLVLAHLKPS